MTKQKELEKNMLVWAKLDNDFYESSKVFEIKEEYVIVGYENFNQTIKKYERPFEDIYLEKDELP